MTDHDPGNADDLEALRKAQQFLAQQARIPAPRRKRVSSPGKYDLPVGMDDQGNVFPPTTASDER